MLSIPDMALLAGAALMFFGPEQLPKVARKAGLLIRDVQNTSQSFIREMERAGDDTYSGPDISRAHLIEEASGTTPAYTPEPYKPTEYTATEYTPYEPPAEPYVPTVFQAPMYEPVETDAHVAEMFAEHTAAADVPVTETPILHDTVAPHATATSAGHDLPP